MVFDRFMVTSSKRDAMIKADGDIVHKGRYTSIGLVTMMYQCDMGHGHLNSKQMVGS